MSSTKRQYSIYQIYEHNSDYTGPVDVDLSKKPEIKPIRIETDGLEAKIIEGVFKTQALNSLRQSGLLKKIEAPNKQRNSREFELNQSEPLKSRNLQKFETKSLDQRKQRKTKFDVPSRIRIDTDHELNKSFHELKLKEVNNENESFDINLVKETIVNTENMNILPRNEEARRGQQKEETNQIKSEQMPENDSDSIINNVNKKPDPMLKYSYYLPEFTAKNSEKLLKIIKKDGLFLLRKSRQEAYQAYSLSVYFKQVVYHLKVRVLNSGYTIGMPKEDELIFESIPDIIDYFIMNPIAIKGVPETFCFVLDNCLLGYAFNFQLDNK